MYPTIIKYVLATLFIVIAVVTDYKEFKIRNKHILIFIVVGLVINTLIASAVVFVGSIFGGASTSTILMAGLQGLLDSVYGLLVPLVLIPLFAVKMLGAGDIKGLCAIGSIVGLRMSIYTTLLSFVAGGVIALGFMIFRKNAWQRFKQLGAYFKQCFYMRKLLPYNQFTDETSSFRFSLGILGGFLLASIWNYI